MFTVKQARLYAGKSQADIAKELGVHTVTYGTLERNPTSIRFFQAKKIAEATGIDYDEINFFEY